VLRFIGIDAHKDTLAAVVIDEHGRQLDAQTFANEPDGYSELIQWATQFGTSRIGIEGSGSLGRQAAPALQEDGFAVVDVPPQLTALCRRHGRNQSKTDPIDALIIARIVLRDQELPGVRPPPSTSWIRGVCACTWPTTTSSRQLAGTALPQET
jgi:transposase